MRGAFTLIELIVSIIIIGILAALALPMFGKTFETTRARHARAALRQIRTAEKIYRTSEEFYYPHYQDHAAAEEDEATINSFLKIFLDTREKDWKYEIDTDTADDFTATAERTSGGNAGETITIDQDGTIDETNWTP